MLLNEFERTLQFDKEILNPVNTFYSGSNMRNKNSDRFRYERDYWDRKLTIDLKKIGWVRAGKGAFSEVFTNPTKDFVLKITKKPDRAFAWFALMTQLYPNKHFPKISNAKIYNINGINYHIFLIEKLIPVKKTPFISTLGRIADRFIYRKSNVLDNNFYVNNCNIKSKSVQQVIQYLKENPSFEKALYILRNNENVRTKILPDIHSKNIMQRTDGTLVLTDPVYNGFD